MLTLSPASDLSALVGESLGVSDWFEIDQERIDAFAAITLDEQWIHVDPERAASGPYGTTVAHGYLLLALLPALGSGVVQFTGFGAVVNYGLERVRFPSPTKVDSRVRDRLSLDAVESVAKGTLLKVTHTIELEGQERPACVAQQLRLLLP